MTNAAWSVPAVALTAAAPARASASNQYNFVGGPQTFTSFENGTAKNQEICFPLQVVGNPAPGTVTFEIDNEVDPLFNVAATTTSTVITSSSTQACTTVQYNGESTGSAFLTATIAGEGENLTYTLQARA